MADIPAEAIEAAAEAIASASNFNDGESERWESRHLARAALEAAAPLLAETVRREIVAAIREHSRARDCNFCGRLSEAAELEFKMQRLDRVCGVDHAADLAEGVFAGATPSAPPAGTGETP